MRAMMKQLKLTVNETKTRMAHLPDDTFDFLGYTFGRLYSQRTGNAYLGCRPSTRKVRSICDAVSQLTQRDTRHFDTAERVKLINRKLIGWRNYFAVGTVAQAWRTVDNHARCRLRQWLRKKHQVQGSGKSRFRKSYLCDTLGLVQLGATQRGDPWATT